jgi:protein TonB
MTVTVFLAALFHLIVILGVSFAPPVTDSGSVPTLEVLLVNSALPESLRNDSADYLAERTQQGSGNSPDGRTRRPVAGSVAAANSGAPDGGDAPSAHESETAAEGELLTGFGGEPVYAAAVAGRQTPPAVLPLETFAGSSSPFSGSSTDVEFQLKGAPRRELLVTPNTRISDVAIYLDAWKRRIEQLGTINFPNAARRSRLSGNPVIEVVLASSGGLVRADVRRSSGHGELDRAALDILKLATPFEAFPEDLAARYEVLRFAYEWRFVGGRLTGSSVEVPAQ